MNQLRHFTKGMIRQNPLLAMGLGIFPALATTSTALTGFGMGLATTFVLCLSNGFISLVKDFVPDKVRFPAFIIIIACFVSIADMLMQAYTPTLSGQLGIFVPLILVNSMVLIRAEAFAANTKAFSSIIEGLGMGLGFTLALTAMGIIREVLGMGAVFGHPFIAHGDNGILGFILAPGAFITLGFLIALWRRINKKT